MAFLLRERLLNTMGNTVLVMFESKARDFGLESGLVLSGGEEHLDCSEEGLWSESGLSVGSVT